ncbi:MAG: hypothetical protein R3E39_05430 [Anaerolineae bacterium]
MSGLFRTISAGIVLLVSISACVSSAVPTVEATLTLIVPTSTTVPPAATATLTSTPLPRSVDITDLTPTFSASAEIIDSAIAVTLESDAVAGELVALAQRRVAQDLNLPTRRVRIVAVEAYVWPDISLGCPEPDQNYVLGDIDGYRILLEVGDVQYIFHTDFDRVVPCKPENEKLP